MKQKPDPQILIWLMSGFLIMLLLILAQIYLRDQRSQNEQIAFKAKRVEIISKMQADLWSAAEAEKSAVMAITDQDSKIFAEAARAATATVEQESRDLASLLNSGGTADEKKFIDQFLQTFSAFKHIDDELLKLAVQNTNLKAYRLAFGPAAAAINQMNESLSHIVATNKASVEAVKILMLSFGAQTGGLRIQTLLAPHIAEESNEKMDKLESLMAAEDKQVRNALAGLASCSSVCDTDALAKADSFYNTFNRHLIKILSLSRENTNVRSLSISLDQKRKVQLSCQELLSALKQAILDEPVRGITTGAPVNPRSLR
jgi:hypothetical protein